MKIYSDKTRIKNNTVRIPASVARYMKIKDGQPLSIFIEGDFLVIGKAFAHCEICNADYDLIVYRNFTICVNCVKILQELANEYKKEQLKKVEEVAAQSAKTLDSFEKFIEEEAKDED